MAGLTQGKLAVLLGIKGSTLSLKVNGKAEFKLTEVNKLRSILHLSDDDVLSIFFSSEVA